MRRTSLGDDTRDLNPGPKGKEQCLSEPRQLKGRGCGETPCLELTLSHPFSRRGMGTRPFPSCVCVSRDLHVAFSMGATSEWVVVPSELGGNVEVLLQHFAEVWDFENTLQEE